MLPILLALAFIAILFIVVIAGQTEEFVTARTTTISALPEKVFPHVNDLHNWDAWSPWAKLDPAAKNSFEGPPAGIGAVMSWDGNKKVGAGKMTITGSKVNELIQIRLEFIRPFQATNTAKFDFKTEGSQTVVTWTMFVKRNFFFKIFGLFKNCDDLLGKDFEKGLATLKSVTEVPAA
jgi:hypothetical protein